MRTLKVTLITLLVIAAVGIGGSIAALIGFPQQTAAFVRPFSASLAQFIYPSTESGRASDAPLAAETDASFSTEGEEAIYREAHKGHPSVNPLVAQCEGVDLHSPVDPADITGVLFHQASYEYGLAMTTQLPDANLEAVSTDNPAYVNREQLEGDWLDAQALHLWRTSDATAMDTSLDLGAAAGTVVCSPVTGTVVLVKDYKLYEELPDVEIHIQPDGRPDLDVVLIHNDGVTVQAGEQVQAGVTEIAHVRDIASYLTDVQLSFYTAGDDPGNHTHVQVNDANYKDYREKRLEGAFTP